MLKKVIFYLFSALLLFACSSKKESSVIMNENKINLLVGTYTSGSSKGIYVYSLDTVTGETEYVSEISGVANPSYLTVSGDGQFVYSVGEDTGEEAVANAFSFDRMNGTLTFINSEQTKGDHPCHISIDKDRKFVATANYTGGNLSIFPLMDDGSLLQASQVINFHINGAPDSRIHTSLFTPDSQYLLVTDLGKDKIYAFTVNPDPSEFGQFLQNQRVAAELEKGSGPRHLAFHPNGHYLYCLNELSGKVTAFQYNDGKLTAIQYIASDTTPGVGGKGSADIHLTADGRFLYASNRLKSDGIAIFSVNPDNGTLTSIGYQSTGIHPRNFILTPNEKFLLVASRDNNNVRIYEIEKTGLLKDTGKEILVDKPVCLKFIERD